MDLPHTWFDSICMNRICKVNVRASSAITAFHACATAVTNICAWMNDMLSYALIITIPLVRASTLQCSLKVMVLGGDLCISGSVCISGHLWWLDYCGSSNRNLQSKLFAYNKASFNNFFRNWTFWGGILSELLYLVSCLAVYMNWIRFQSLKSNTWYSYWQ